MKKYKKANDQEKNDIKTVFNNFIESTVDYCNKNNFPTTWVWSYLDISSEPQWPDSTEKNNFDSHVATLSASHSDSDIDVEMTDERSTPEDSVTVNDNSNRDDDMNSTSVSSITVNGKLVIAKEKSADHFNA